MKILLIEDEQSVADFIVAGLSKHGYEVDTTPRGAEGLNLALHFDYDLVILDLILPDQDGLDVLRALREAGRATRILVLTCRSKAQDRIMGLDMGADDYLAKPFDFGELLAHVRALLRRTPLDISSSVFRLGELELDTRRRYVTRNGRELRLPAKQFAILEHLMRNSNRVVSRRDLAKTIWSAEPDASNNVIDVTVHLLRENLDRGFPYPLIHTVRGVGYQLGITPPAPPPAANSSQPNRSVV